MKKLIKYSLLFLIVSTGFENLYAQSLNDTIQIKEVKIEDYKISADPFYKKERIGEMLIRQYSTNNLGELINATSPVFIKSYGPGSLTVTSFRGMGASHTNITWNGINVNSPTHGQFDLSLFPLFFTDEVEVLYGIAGLSMASGGLGGTINMVNTTAWNETRKINFEQVFGSFGTSKTFAGIQYGNKRFQNKIKIFYQESENDFPFINTAESSHPIQKQKSAAYFQSGILNESYFKINAFNTMSLKFWYQNSERNIPPPMVTSDNDEKQRDENVRLMLDWKREKEKTELVLKTALFNDNLNYRNNIAWINSHSLVRSSKNQLLFNYNLTKKISLNTGLFSDYDEAAVDGYQGREIQVRNAIFAAYNHRLNRHFKYNFQLRQEAIDNSFAPLMGALAIYYQPFEKEIISCFANAGNNYRFPTLNELYWMPGGNPDIKPEHSRNAEAGINLKKSIYEVFFDNKLTVFYNHVDNWILWSPSVYGYWQAQNLKEVLAKGYEISSSAKRDFNKVSAMLSLVYSHTESINLKAVSGLDESVNKQLIYTPVYLFRMNMNIMYKGFRLYYLQNYTGWRYTSTDNSSYLPAFYVADTSLEKEIKLKQHKLSVRFSVNNLYNTSYQVINWRAMPGRNYQIFLSYNLGY